MTTREAKEKALKEIAALKYSTFNVWCVGGQFFLCEYVQNGKKREFFGHTFKIDFNKKELVTIK